ncbi:unnamed protein product [Linum tenue]|uniref:Uncharacterized protein n=1 Tax=Linum tenue TaxID=586396 RepID=A0AAV0IU89_9ROSI|nr:unnamed protein product [Linum tenue]
MGLPVDAVVRELIDEEEEKWDDTLLESCFPTSMAQASKQIPLCSPEDPDRLTWADSVDGQYTAKEGYKVWLRNFQSQHEERRVKRVKGIRDPTLGEAMTVEFGLQLARRHQLATPFVETDCLSVVNSLEKADEVHTEVGTVLRSIMRLVAMTCVGRVMHVSRQANEAAHIMAYTRARWDIADVCFDRPPLNLLDQLVSDNVTQHRTLNRRPAIHPLRPVVVISASSKCPIDNFSSSPAITMPTIQTHCYLPSPGFVSRRSLLPGAPTPIGHGSLGFGFSAPSHSVKFSFPADSFGRKSSSFGSDKGSANGQRRRRCGTVRAAGRDHYSTLNVGRKASLQEIKSAYRKLARKYHPDLNRGPGAEDKFKEISAAYEVLSDDEKRSVYDRFGEAGLQGEYDGSAAGSPEMDPFDIYNTFFGGSDGIFGGRDGAGGFGFNFRHTAKQDLDIQYCISACDLFLSLEESVFGGEQNIEVSGFETCGTCDGTGAKSSDCIKSCTGCGGKGGVMKTQRTPFGMISQVSTCSKCGGKGKVITDCCQRCGGSGNISAKRQMRLNIPPGVSNGSTIKLRGEGNFDKMRGFAGNLYLNIHVNEKRGIQRDGLNLYSKINIDYTEAILGAVLKVETVEGAKDLHIPPGIQPGETVKLLRLGVPDINKPSVRGDHHFTVNVLIPKYISDRERALVKELVSFKSSSKANDTSSDSSGTFKGNARRDRTQRSKGVASVWGTIKDFMGKRRDQQRFSSVTLSTPPLTLARSSELPIQVSILGVVLLTIFLTFTRRINEMNAKKQ